MVDSVIIRELVVLVMSLVMLILLSLLKNPRSLNYTISQQLNQSIASTNVFESRR